MLAHGQAGLPKATPTGTGRKAGYADAGGKGLVLGWNTIGLVRDGIGLEREDAFQPLSVAVKRVGVGWLSISLVV